MVWLRYKIRVREFVADNPVPWVGITAVLGIVIGLALGDVAVGVVVGVVAGLVQATQVRRGSPSYERIRERQDAKLRLLTERRDSQR